MVDLTAATLVVAVGTADRETPEREAIACANNLAATDTITFAGKVEGLVRPRLGKPAVAPSKCIR